MLLRRLNKSKSLRLVNLLGLSVIFACLLLSYAYVRKEMRYDRFHRHAERIFRLSFQTENEPTDVRIHGFAPSDPALAGVAGIEAVVRMHKSESGELRHEGRNYLTDHFYFVSGNFFEVFDFKLLDGDPHTVLDSPEKAVISRSYANRLFGDVSPVGKEFELVNGRKFADRKVFISGVFEDFPETSHFHTDLLVHLPDDATNLFSYVYLLLHPQTNIADLQQGITANLKKLNSNAPRKVFPLLFPLTDIHLHSHFQREHEPNSNIYYIYLIACANLLLLLIVLFNLWLNAGLIFSFNRRYYQLLRLNGASSWRVFWDECLLALILGGAAVLAGLLLAQSVMPGLFPEVTSNTKVLLLLCVLFPILVMITSVIPVIRQMSSTRFLSMQFHSYGTGFTLSNIRYMLIGQYAIVMFVVIVSVCISRQIGLIRTMQVGGKERTILVMREQPASVIRRYGLLKTDLAKHPEIRRVTSAMQLPGSAIRDGVYVRTDQESEDEGRRIPVLVVGEDFIPFFGIRLLSGTSFSKGLRTLEEEEQMLFDSIDGKPAPDITEEYVINRKAAEILGFNTPNEAVGQRLHIRHGQGGVDYINKGMIVGVTENFNYTTTYDDAIPQLLLQRALFQHCLMVYLSPDDTKEALRTFNRVWQEINPEYPAQYTFLHDVYDSIYYNELHAEQLTHIFSALCLLVATLGLIIIMAFIVKRKTKEIGIRKINGAQPSDILRMLNYRFVIWIGIAFLLAVPGAYMAMTKWLEIFAFKTTLDWWVFLFAGLSVLLLSVAAVSWQSWRAATINPVKTLKSE